MNKKFSWQVFFIKITSRKFWVALGGFVTGVLTTFGVQNSVVVQIGGLILSLGSVVGYLIANGLSDGDSK